MYKVIIVEDEMLVRVGLRNSVDWSKFGMEVVADLHDGQAAWDYCQNQGYPDLMITDIRMPRMDGMELISNIRRQDKTIKIVVLTCLEEFGLVRQAMSLGVSHYILKLTMTEEEIEEILGGIAAELQARERGGPPQNEGSLVPGNLDLIKEKVIKDFLFYGIYSVSEFEKFVEQSGIRLTPHRMVACTMEVDHYAGIRRKLRDDQGHLIRLTVLNILHEITNSCQRGETICLNETRYLLLFSFEDIISERSLMQELHAVLGTVQEAMVSCFTESGSVSFGISSVQSGFSSLRKMYAESGRALERKFYAGPGQRHTDFDPLELNLIRTQVEEIRQYAPLRNLLSPMRVREYDEYWDGLLDGVTNAKPAVRILLYQLIQWVSSHLYDDHQNEKTLLLSKTEMLDECGTLPEMLRHVHAYFIEAAEQAQTHLQMSNEITKAIQYIKHNYPRNISLQQVADHVNLSSGYLSNLFKKELQVTFVEYLNLYRIERAKELLAHTTMKSYDIAVQVGFSPEYTYFSKVFKKVTGLNPNEYRKQWVSGGSWEGL